MTTPSTQTPSGKKPRAGKRTRKADAAETNPDILCHQIGLCKNLAELQAFISKHNLLNVIGDERFTTRMQLVIEEALDTMTDVLQAPEGSDLSTLFPVPQDLANKGWSMEREGVSFKFIKGQLATNGYVIREEAAEAARKLDQRESKHKGASPEAASGDDKREVAEIATGDDEASSGHEFKPTTGKNGRCSVCGLGSATDAHRTWKAGQRERVKAGKPTRDSKFWREQAAGMTPQIVKQLREYDTPGRKTLRKIEEYEARIRDGLKEQQWQATLINIADAIDEGTLPPVLYGLSNNYQVRQLIGSVSLEFKPSNMGATIKTIEDLSAAHEALKPFVPELHEDPNLDPRDGTEWATPLTVADGEQSGWHEYFEQTPGEGCFLQCGKPSEDPIHRNPDQAPFVAGGGCPPDCGHTVEEHDAFDAGLAAGEQGYDTDGCPHDGGELRVAWHIGHDVGAGNRSATLAASGDVVEDTPATDGAPVEPRAFTKEVEITLNDHDIAEKARKLTFLRVQIEELQAEKKKTDDGYKARIGGLEEECADLFRSIRLGRETRDEKVFERRDYDRHVVETVRCDDGEIVETRNMRPTEYQQPLPSI